MHVRECLCVPWGSAGTEKRDFSTGSGCFLNNEEIAILMHFLYGLMVAGSLKMMQATEQFCPVANRIKTDVTVNQLDKAQFREADIYKGSFTLYSSGVTVSNPAE